MQSGGNPRILKAFGPGHWFPTKWHPNDKMNQFNCTRVYTLYPTLSDNKHEQNPRGLVTILIKITDNVIMQPGDPHFPVKQY